MQIGDKIEFSGYDWRVLDIKDNAALIITEDIVELRAYHNKPGDITWADCELSVCCIIKIQKVAEGNAEKCICILHKNAELKERVTL